MGADSNSDAATVCVLIPVFNRRTLIAAAVESALSQDVEGLQVMVVDNCSTDGTWELLASMRHEQLHCLRNDSNLGLFGNFNRCGELARGKYTLFLCSDDRLQPGFLRSAVARMEAAPAAVLLSSRGLAVDAHGNERGLIATRFPAGQYLGRSVPAAWFWSNYHYGGNPLNYPSGVLFRTGALRECLPFRAQFGAPADIDLYLRVLMHGDLLVTDDVGCAVMHHDAQEADAIRRTGDLARQDLALLEEFRPQLEADGAYEKIRRQTAHHVLATVVGIARFDFGKALRLLRDFRRSPLEMVAASIRLKSLRAAERLFGMRQVPYLRPAAPHAASQDHLISTGMKVSD